MRSKAPLGVMELVIMLLVFAMAAAICLRAFAWADSTSRQDESCDLALVQAQNAAAVIKHSRGDLTAAARTMGGRVEQEQWMIGYDGQWVQTDGSAAFTLQVSLLPSRPLMGKARVSVADGGQELARLEVSWQEVTADEG